MGLNKYSKRMNMKREINEIINSYPIQEIEAALIKVYIQSHNIKVEKNKLILNYLKKNNHEILVKRFSDILKSNNLKSVERIFELLIKPEDRKVNGAFYTPDYIVKYIVDNTIQGDITVCDPSCGSGAFLIEAIEKIHKDTNKSIISIIENNIFGSDILNYAIQRTKILLSLLALSYGEDKEEIKFNLVCQDSLTSDWTKEFPKILKSGDWKDIFGISESGFDAVIGNPPYVRIQDFSKATKKTIMDRWGKIAKGNFNLHFPFFVLGVRLLKKNGKLGYITPNNYFTSLAAEPLREYLQNNKLLSRILDFDCLQVFEDVTTYTCITFIEKSKKENFEYQIIEEQDKLGNFDKIKFSKINFSDINHKKWRLLNEEDQENIKKTESIGRPLKEITNIHVGIATLKDKLYFIDASIQENGYYVKGVNGKKFLIEKEITKSIRKISSIETEEDLKSDKRRIICPYFVKNGKAEVIPESELKTKYPKCYAYFLFIKDELATRDKGKKHYPKWYAYGRGQGLNRLGKKLLTRTFSNKPRFMLDENEDSLFCNGYAIFPKKGNLDLRVLQKILNSVVMDYFAKKTSVDLEGGYQCYQKNFIESFNIPQLTEQDIKFLKDEEIKNKINEFLIKMYGLDREPLEYFMKA